MSAETFYDIISFPKQHPNNLLKTGNIIKFQDYKFSIK